jgi:hypothetical protein
MWPSEHESLGHAPALAAVFSTFPAVEHISLTFSLSLDDAKPHAYVHFQF